jgi:hypothetical protein
LGITRPCTTPQSHLAAAPHVADVSRCFHFFVCLVPPMLLNPVIALGCLRLLPTDLPIAFKFTRRLILRLCNPHALHFYIFRHLVWLAVFQIVLKLDYFCRIHSKPRFIEIMKIFMEFPPAQSFHRNYESFLGKFMNYLINS